MAVRIGSRSSGSKVERMEGEKGKEEMICVQGIQEGEKKGKDDGSNDGMDYR
jgi:hypothetical protein